MIMGISSPALLAGQTKLANIPRTTTLKASASNIGSKIAEAVSLNNLLYWGARIGVGLGTYHYLTQEMFTTPEGRPESLIGRGSRQFAEAYFGSAPRAYYESAEKYIPLQRELEAKTYQEVQPYYIESAVEKVWAEAEAKAEAYQTYQPYYSNTQTQKSSDIKMPYSPKFM